MHIKFVRVYPSASIRLSLSLLVLRIFRANDVEVSLPVDGRKKDPNRKRSQRQKWEGEREKGEVKVSNERKDEIIMMKNAGWKWGGWRSRRGEKKE